ncbi:type II/IV secretion system ATPase subunit [Haloplanus rubicundus]|uniref:type II/IV secretion system ATPase subunit n=1 Tax=Haloplanus rubicundus TaxID=1547898 RepID=UPI00267C44CB
MAIDDAENSGSEGFDGAAAVGWDDAVDPAALSDSLAAGKAAATRLDAAVSRVQDGAPPVVKGLWTWEDYKREFHYDADGTPPTDGQGEAVPFDPSDTLGFDPEKTENVLSFGENLAAELDTVVDERTVDVDEALDEDAFFETEFGATTVTNRYDLEKTVPMEKKLHFREIDRYWVNKPYAYVVIFQSRKENEKKYYVVQPHTTPIEDDLLEFLRAKLQNAIKYADVEVAGGLDERERVIKDETYALLERYDLYSKTSGSGLLDTIATQLGVESADGTAGRLLSRLGWRPAPDVDEELSGLSVRPEPALVEEDADHLSEYQVEKLLYFLKRDFIGYERIDGIKHDINVEDISCDGYHSPVFVYHSDYEQIISNIYHGDDELDDFVVKLAQRSGKGISKRRPQVDATLPDGSRAQLTLGKEVSDHGTNYTIRQFKDVPFTPVDLINWKTFSLEEMAYLWLAIENNKSLIFAGGTASGKTTSLNAVSLFIPSNSKIVSIEDTREVELPQRNWVASVTRPSFSDDEQGDVDEFDLLEAALRQRPEYIVMGEIRGEEGRTLFQVMSTGHTTLTTFHADSVGEVLKRFTTEPINVSKTMFSALDLVSIQTQTRVGGRKVRRNKNLTEINFYDAENDEINVQDVYQWQAETDEFLRMSNSNTLDEIRFDRGWTRGTLEEELFKREAVLAYLIENGLNTYTQVAATVQAFINDEETILALMANDQLERSLEDLREMESVLIDIDPEKEAMVPRPDPNEAGLELCADILDRAETELFEEYRGEAVPGIDAALTDVDTAADVTASPSTPPSSAEAGGEGGPEFDDAVAGADADGGDDAAGTVDLDESPFDAEPDAGSDSTVGASSGDDGFDISFDDGPTDESGADVDLDWGSSTSGADADEEPAAGDGSPDMDEASTDETNEASTDETNEASTDETNEASTDDSLDDGDDESAADMDEWGFGDVTDADEEE